MQTPLTALSWTLFLSSTNLLEPAVWWHFFQHAKSHYLLLVLNTSILTERVENTTEVSFLECASSACSNLASLSPQTEPSCRFKGEILMHSQSCPQCDPIKIRGMKYLPVMSVIENPVLRLDRKTQLLSYTPKLLLLLRQHWTPPSTKGCRSRHWDRDWYTFTMN